MEILIYGFAFATIAIIIFGIYMFMRSRDPLMDRLTPQTEQEIAAASLRKSDNNVAMERLLQPFQERLKREQAREEYTDERRNLLRSAGYYHPNAGAYLYMIRLLLAIIFAAAMTLGMIFFGGNLDPLVKTLLVVLLGALGYFFPLLALTARAGERKLQFSEGLPDALDMMLICLESGLSFPATLKHVARELEDVHPIIFEHFEIANLEFQAGRKRSDALRNMVKRVDLDELASIVTMINQSDSLGTSLTRAIRAAAEDLRRDRMLRAEEKANALPVKMALPLTLCIFPTLFCIIMVPVVIRIVTLLPG